MPAFVSILVLRAVMGSPAAQPVHAAFTNPESFVVVKTVAGPAPSRAPSDRVRISRPSELIGSVASNSETGGAIEVPANARAGLENSLLSEALKSHDCDLHDAVVTRVYGGYGYRGPLVRVRRVGGSEPGRRDVDLSDRSPFGDSADDAYRRAQLEFYRATYPRLDTFEDAHRRAQLEFHRSTLTPANRGPDGLRRDSTGLGGPELRRERPRR
ncbi:MAG: hypothetical protein AB7G11_11460 [Phycisphaerales bacterium]